MEYKKILQHILIFSFFSSILGLWFYFYPPFFASKYITSYLTFYPLNFPANYLVILGILIVVLIGNALDKRKNLFKILGVVTLVYCVVLLIAGGFSVIGIPFAIGSYIVWLIIGKFIHFLNNVFSKLPYSISWFLLIILALTSIISSKYVFADFNHTNNTALNYKYLDMKLSEIKLSVGDYSVKKQQLSILNMCDGFHNQIYTKSCEKVQLESIQETEFIIASGSKDVPLNYCENYIATIDNGSIEKNSFRYWSGLNLCYKSTAKSVTDCNRIENNQDLRQTCVNELK